jgi:hypothetical protein
MTQLAAIHKTNKAIVAPNMQEHAGPGFKFGMGSVFGMAGAGFQRVAVRENAAMPFLTLKMAGGGLHHPVASY